MKKSLTKMLPLVAAAVCGAAAVWAAPQESKPPPQGRPAAAERTRYRIDLKLDFDARTYAGTERVRWVNRDDRPASVIYFHLYPNLRVEEEAVARRNFAPSQPPAAPAPGGDAGPVPAASDEPRLEVTEVRAAGQNAQSLQFSLDEQATTLRVALREAVPAGASVEVEITFKGSVPELDPDETSLSAHVVQQVGAALRDTRELRRARDTNFVSRGVMLLGSFHPVLAAREGGDWQRKVEPTVGDALHTEVADYEVNINTQDGVRLFTSAGGGLDSEAGGARAGHFAAEGLRSFAVVAGRTLRAEARAVGGVRLVSVFAAEHERTGRRMLAVAADAVATFSARFGPPPVRAVTVTEAPLVAGLGSAEFAGLGVIASAFYVDFDSPSMRNLPQIVREQRASVEDSLEFAVAHVVAHQWWGAAVGSDPAREPVLDEALAHWSALLYYGEVHGAARARLAEEDQLRGVYQIYRTFGGEDMAADRPARDYRNSFQYAAIVASKGALMFEALRRLLGDERFFTALRRYYEANRLEVASLEDLRGAFVAEATVSERRAVTRAFNRWLSEKRGDEDIAPPDPQMAAALGIAVEPPAARDRNAFSRLGRFFWRQMTRIR